MKQQWMFITEEKQIKMANSLGLQPDEMYCMDLLENSGIVVVPG